MALRAPLTWELELLEGCMRAIPDFIARQVGSAQIPVTISGDATTFQFERMNDGG